MKKISDSQRKELAALAAKPESEIDFFRCSRNIRRGLESCGTR